MIHALAARADAGPPRDRDARESRLRAPGEPVPQAPPSDPGAPPAVTCQGEIAMGQAREIMDRVTSAVLAGDRAAIRQLYADDAVAETPDAGRLVGSDAIADYLVGFCQTFPDLSFEMTAELEAGETAVDEGVIIGTHTGSLITPDGEVPATGRSIRLRSCDVLTARDGVAIEHRFYFDQLEFMTQLGLGQEQTIVLPERQARTRTGVGAQG